MGIQDRDYMYERREGARQSRASEPRRRYSRKPGGEWVVGGTLVAALVVLLCLLAVPLWKVFGPRDLRPPEASAPSQAGGQPATSLPNPLRGILPAIGDKGARLPEVMPIAKPAQPFPPSGSVISYQDLTGQKMAGFSIDASGTGAALHAIKVEEWNTQRPVLVTFVLGGVLAKLEVPLGIYRIKIASGDTWYGMDDLFGPGTRVQTAEKPLQFYAEGNTITGHTLYLQSVGGGNRFPTAEAARREF